MINIQHVTKPTHTPAPTHTHTHSHTFLQTPLIPLQTTQWDYTTPWPTYNTHTRFKTHTYTRPPIHTPSHTHTHPFLQTPLIYSPIHFRIKQPLLQDTLDLNSHSTFQDPQYNVPLTLAELLSPPSFTSLHFIQNISHKSRRFTPHHYAHDTSLHLFALITHLKTLACDYLLYHFSKRI